MAYEYVKFQRGSQTAYDNKVAANQIDQNTLYFIYENNNSLTGKLYLGTKLISGGSDVDSLLNNLTLENLSNVNITDEETGDFLVLNAEGNWINKPATEVVSSILSNNINDKQFIYTDGKLNLLGIDNAESGKFLTVDEDGKLSWINPETDNIADFENDVKGIIDEVISDGVKISYSKINSLDEATEGNTIYLLPTSNESDNSSFEEYLVVDGVPELLGSIGNLPLNDYIKKSDIGDITALTNYSSSSPTTVVNEINNLYQMLTWQSLDDI